MCDTLYTRLNKGAFKKKTIHQQPQKDQELKMSLRVFFVAVGVMFFFFATPPCWPEKVRAREQAKFWRSWNGNVVFNVHILHFVSVLFSSRPGKGPVCFLCWRIRLFLKWSWDNVTCQERSLPHCDLNASSAKLERFEPILTVTRLVKMGLGQDSVGHDV